MNVHQCHGKARILYARRNFPQALKLFQLVLQLNPHCQPDPRIGIGLCLWAMDHKVKAKAAWERSLELVSLTSEHREISHEQIILESVLLARTTSPRFGGHKCQQNRCTI